MMICNFTEFVLISFYLICSNCYVIDGLVSKTFMVTKEKTGLNICATNDPSVEMSISSAIQCSARCRLSRRCAYFNYIKATRKCQIYFNKPQTLSTISGCSGYSNEAYSDMTEKVQAKRGQTVKFKCKQTSPMVTWKYHVVENDTIKLIAENCKVLDNYIGLYSVSAVGNNCDLIITDVQLSQAGTYICEDQSDPDVVVSTELAVFDSAPNCSTNNTTTYVYLGKFVNISCSLNYRGNSTTISVVWLNNNKTLVENSVAVSFTTSLLSYIVVRGQYPLINSFQCQVVDQNHLNISSCQTNPVNVVCPSGFVFLNESNSCYQLLFQSLTWTMARRSCEQLCNGCYSVVINSSSEQDAVASYLTTMYSDSRSSSCWVSQIGKVAWLAAQRVNDTWCSWPFIWKPTEHGPTFPSNYTNWANAEPNCSLGSQFCVAILSYFKWDDLYCNTQCCPLCEYGDI